MLSAAASALPCRGNESSCSTNYRCANHRLAVLARHRPDTPLAVCSRGSSIYFYHHLNTVLCGPAGHTTILGMERPIAVIAAEDLSSPLAPEAEVLIVDYCVLVLFDVLLFLVGRVGCGLTAQSGGLPNLLQVHPTKNINCEIYQVRLICSSTILVMMGVLPYSSLRRASMEKVCRHSP